MFITKLTERGTEQAQPRFKLRIVHLEQLSVQWTFLTQFVDGDSNLDTAEVLLNFAHVLKLLSQRLQRLLDGVLKQNSNAQGPGGAVVAFELPTQQPGFYS